MPVDYQQHELGQCYPVLGREALDDLAEDIKNNGQKHPIELFDGEILDGWNRYLACGLAGVDPWAADVTAELKGTDLVGYVLSVNGFRRHLSVKDRAIAAAKLSETNFFKDAANAAMQAGTLPPNGGRVGGSEAIPSAAKATGVSTRSAQRAAKVLSNGSAATQKALDHDKISLGKAAEVSRLPKSEQAAAVKAAIAPKLQSPKNGSIAPDKRKLLRICEKSFGELFRSAIKLGIDEEKYGHHFEAIIKEVNRLGGKK